MRILALLVVLLLPSVAWAQVGFLQAVPGTPRPTCASIPSPVKNQTWCADAENGPGSYLWKVWNGVSYVTVGGGGGGGIPGGPNMSIQFNDSATFNGDAQLEWNKTTKQLLVPGIQYLSTGTANVSPVLISRFTHVAPTEPEVGNMLVQSATTPATDVHVVLGAFDMISTTGSFASGKLHRDRVALYSGIHGSTNSGNIWSYNSDTLMLPGSGDYFAQGAEIDFTNNNVDRGDADGELGLQGFFAAPLFFDSLSTKRSTAGIFFSGLNSPKMWNRGIVFAFDAISATGSTFQDSTNGLKSVDIRGHPTFGIYQNPDVPGLPVTRNFFAGGVDLVGSSLRLFEPNYVFHVDIGASTGLAQDMLYLWPSVPGAFGNCLITDGSAGFQTLSWGACSGGAVVGLHQIAVGTGPSVTGFADFTWNEVNSAFVATNAAPTLTANYGNIAVIASPTSTITGTSNVVIESGLVAAAGSSLVGGTFSQVQNSAIIAAKTSTITGGVQTAIIASIGGTIADQAKYSAVIGGTGQIGATCASCVSLADGIVPSGSQVVAIGGTARESSQLFLGVVASFGQASANGQYTSIRALSEERTILAAASTDTTIQAPANSLVLSVSVRVTTAIPTAATFDVGVAGATTRYGTAISTAATTTAASPGTTSPSIYPTATNIRITPNVVPGAATGKVRVTITYIDITPPSS